MSLTSSANPPDLSLLRAQLSRLAFSRVTIVGVGNRMRGDDAAGCLVLDALADQTAALCIDAGSTPENHLERIVATRPGTVLLVDAADFGGAAGEIRVFGAEDIAGGGLTTHALSLQMLADYLHRRCEAQTLLLAIQPERTALDTPPSRAVADAVSRLAQVLAECAPA